MINNKNKRDELKKLIEKNNDVYALVEYLDKYRYYKEDIDYLLHSFKNIETNCAYTLECKDYWYFFEEYIRFLTIAMSNGYIENNKENRNKVEELIAKNIKREKCTSATYLYAARFYRNMYLGHIDEYIDKKYEIIQLYEKAALKGSNQAQKEKQNFLEKIENLKKQPTEKENKNNLIKLIDNKNDFPALIDFMDNYHTENQDIEYILYNFKKIEDNSSHLLKKIYYWRFFAEYIRALHGAIDKEVIENNAENRNKVEELINKTTSQKDCPHVAYLYAARFYKYMYMRNIHGYRNTDTRAKIISLYETASFNGNIFARDEKLKFLAQADTFVKSPEKIKNEVVLPKDEPSQETNYKLLDFDPKLINANTDLIKLTAKLEKSNLPFTLLISGPPGTGKSYYLRYLAQRMGKNFLEKTSAELFSKFQGEPSKNVLTLFKNAENKKAGIILDEIETITGDRGKNSDLSNPWRSEMTNTFLTCLENTQYPFMATTNFISKIDKAILRRFVFKIKFDYLKPDQIEYAFRLTFNLEPPAGLLKLGGLTNGDFAIVKKKAEILDCLSNVQELYNMLKEEVSVKAIGNVVHLEEKINFDRNFVNIEGSSLDLYVKKIKENKINNFSILLHGPSGTGKSLYLRHLAQELGYELIERRSSDILSRWHGESEQNLANAFEEAKNRRAILIFDEIDSFLSSKNNMMQVHNAQLVNEFLVQLENHPYPVCGTTNYLENMEQASLRRFKINAKFDYLHKDQYNYVYNKTFGVEPPKEINKFTKLTPAIFTLAAEKVSLEDAQKDEKRIFEIFSEEVKRCTGENIHQKEDQTYEKLFINKSDLYTNLITDNYDKVLTGFVKVITDKGYGSGFFITDNGFILTNKHVVHEQTIVKIKLFSGREIPGEVIRTNNLDIALIKVSEENKVYPMTIKTEELSVGSTVFCLGNPKGHDQVLSKGCITRYTYDTEKNPRIETDCVLNKGSSGGPLFDEFGNVIGVNVQGWREERGALLGINLHVPINDALNALNIKFNS